MTDSATALAFDDSVDAFCRENHVAIPGAEHGPLAGLTFAAKDVFHVTGHRTGFGHPEWLRTHPPAAETAAVITRLVEAGATMVGKTHTDELAYSLSGENSHYGTPGNAAAPGHIPGGSSNGSAAAVAANLVDFAIGTDCGGSIRIPASYCGLYGLRPTVDRVPTEGVIPFGPPFDVVGWLTRDPNLLAAVGEVLLGEDPVTSDEVRIIKAADAFAAVSDEVCGALDEATARIETALGSASEMVVSPPGLPAWFDIFRIVQAASIWSNHGAWITRVKPQLGPGVRERFEIAARLDQVEIEAARASFVQIRAHLLNMMQPEVVLIMPTSPRGAPSLGTPVDDLEVHFRNQAMHLLCVAGLGGLPQITLPFSEHRGLPLGISLIGARGTDRRLLNIAKNLGTASGS